MALLTPAMTVVLGLLIAALIGSVVTVLMSVNDLAI
jgi:type II secretory pathway component PulF